tara:strand:+ start:359 stop:544 length:186 start_codon:yes stop_codon:yes gene_type:complete
LYQRHQLCSIQGWLENVAVIFVIIILAIALHFWFFWFVHQKKLRKCHILGSLFFPFPEISK